MTKDEMREAIDTLPPRDKDVWEAVTLLGVPACEYAVGMNMSEDAVDNAINREEIRYLVTLCNMDDPKLMVNRIIEELEKFKLTL